MSVMNKRNPLLTHRRHSAFHRRIDFIYEHYKKKNRKLILDNAKKPTCQHRHRPTNYPFDKHSKKHTIRHVIEPH